MKTKIKSQDFCVGSLHHVTDLQICRQPTCSSLPTRQLQPNENASEASKRKKELEPFFFLSLRYIYIKEFFIKLL